MSSGVVAGRLPPGQNAGNSFDLDAPHTLGHHKSRDRRNGYRYEASGSRLAWKRSVEATNGPGGTSGGQKSQGAVKEIPWRDVSHGRVPCATAQAQRLGGVHGRTAVHSHPKPCPRVLEAGDKPVQVPEDVRGLARRQLPPRKERGPPGWHPLRSRRVLRRVHRQTLHCFVEPRVFVLCKPQMTTARMSFLPFELDPSVSLDKLLAKVGEFVDGVALNAGHGAALRNARILEIVGTNARTGETASLVLQIKRLNGEPVFGIHVENAPPPRLGQFVLPLIDAGLYVLNGEPGWLNSKPTTWWTVARLAGGGDAFNRHWDQYDDGEPVSLVLFAQTDAATVLPAGWALFMRVFASNVNITKAFLGPRQYIVRAPGAASRHAAAGGRRSRSRPTLLRTSRAQSSIKKEKNWCSRRCCSVRRRWRAYQCLSKPSPPSSGRR